MEMLQNGVATYFQATSLFSMRTVSLAALKIDTDAWCKRTISLLNSGTESFMSMFVPDGVGYRSVCSVIQTQPPYLPTDAAL